jgi:HAMP domain-containing protein/GAF domain-containing protein
MFGFKLNIQNSIFLQLFIIATLITINYLVVASYDANLSEIEKTIDLVESNGTYSQEIIYYSKLILEGKEDYRVKLKEVIDKHDENVRVLKVGGKSNENNSYITSLPEELKAGYFYSFEISWNKFKDNANVIANKNLYLADQSINPELIVAYDYLFKNNQNLLKKNDELVAAYLAYFDSKQDRRDKVLNFIFIINVALVALIAIYIYYKVIRPISRLNEIQAIINEGNFERKIDYTRDDELGKVAKSINRLFESLSNATDFIIAIGEGKLEAEYEQINEADSKKDRLGNALREMRDKMKQVAEIDAQRNWVSEGLAKFADIFRNHGQSEDFTYIIVSNLVKYTNTNQGALFLAEESEKKTPVLQMMAAYAYGKRKYMQKTIQKGEGLVGEVFQEGSTVYMTEVPENYIYITSGLGEATPRSLLLVPMKLNDQIYGVVELASFEEIPPYKIEFVEKLSESIASTFASVKNNQRTQRLLEEQLEMAQQMRAGEEEMRQNLEELMSTQEELERKNAIMEEQKAELIQKLADEQLKIKEILNEKIKIQQELDTLKEKLLTLENKNEELT